MKKENFNYLSHSQLKSLSNLHAAFRQDRDQNLTDLMQDDTLKSLLRIAPTWSIWYELPTNLYIYLILEVLGVTEAITHAITNGDDAEQILIDLVDEPDKDSDKELSELGDPEKAVIVSFFFSLNFNIEAVGGFEDRGHNFDTVR